jgi:hypothetical protein
MLQLLSYIDKKVAIILLYSITPMYTGPSNKAPQFTHVNKYIYTFLLFGCEQWYKNIELELN